MFHCIIPYVPPSRGEGNKGKQNGKTALQHGQGGEEGKTWPQHAAVHPGVYSCCMPGNNNLSNILSYESYTYKYFQYVVHPGFLHYTVYSVYFQ